MIARRRFVLLAALAPVLAWPQSRRYRIAMLGLESRASLLSGEHDRFHAALASLGYTLGRNLDIDERYANDPEQLLRFAAELAAARPDLILTEGTPATLAVQKATRTIPVATNVGDPVGAGFARTLQSPGGNITGFSQNRTALARKQVEIIRLLRPNVRTIALVYEEPLPGAEILLRGTIEAVREASLASATYAYRAGEFASVLEKLKARHIDTAIGMGLRRAEADAAIQKRIAVLGTGLDVVKDGALASIEPDNADDPMQMALLVDKLLKGARPAETPFAEPTRYRLSFNTRTAAALGLRVPAELMLRVDQIVDR